MSNIREKGSSPYSGSFEPQQSAPLDARSRTPTYESLFLEETWKAHDGNSYAYEGMQVTVYADPDESLNGAHMLKKLPVTDSDNWQKIGEVKEIDAYTRDEVDALVAATDSTVSYKVFDKSWYVYNVYGENKLCPIVPGEPEMSFSGNTFSFGIQISEYEHLIISNGENYIFNTKTDTIIELDDKYSWLNYSDGKYSSYRHTQLAHDKDQNMLYAICMNGYSGGITGGKMCLRMNIDDARAGIGECEVLTEAPIGNQMFVVGGYYDGIIHIVNPTFITYAGSYRLEYDVLANTWSEKIDIPVEYRTSHYGMATGVTIRNKCYYLGIQNSQWQLLSFNYVTKEYEIVLRNFLPYVYGSSNGTQMMNLFAVGDCLFWNQMGSYTFDFAMSFYLYDTVTGTFRNYKETGNTDTWSYTSIITGGYILNHPIKNKLNILPLGTPSMSFSAVFEMPCKLFKPIATLYAGDSIVAEFAILAGKDYVSIPPGKRYVATEECTVCTHIQDVTNGKYSIIRGLHDNRLLASSDEWEHKSATDKAPTVKQVSDSLAELRAEIAALKTQIGS